MNRRCDDLIEVLLKFEEDMFHSRMSREILRSSNDASQCQDGNRRHQNSTKISDSDIHVSHKCYDSHHNYYNKLVNLLTIV